MSNFPSLEPSPQHASSGNVPTSPFVPAGARLPSPLRRKLLRLGIRLGVVLVAFVVLVGIIGHRLNTELHAEPGKVGDCFTASPRSDGQVTRVSCSSSKASTRAVALAPASFFTTPDCPDNTDSFLQNQNDFAGKIACVVNLRGSHPGAPGAGGGVIRTGDCVKVDTLFSSVDETACDRRSSGLAKVLARGQDRSACPAGTKAVLTLQGVSRPVLCLDQTSRSVDGAATPPRFRPAAPTTTSSGG